MVKKVILFACIVIIVLLIAGGYLFYSNNEKSLQSSQGASSTPKPTSGSMMDQVTDLFAKSVSVTCDYTDEEGRKTLAYVKAGAVRVDTSGKTPEESGSVIVKDNRMHFWNGNEGITMEFNTEEMMKNAPSITISPNPSGSKQEGANGQEVLASLEKFKDNCKPTVVNDSVFIPPSNVKFVDYTQMMKQTQSGSGMTQEQLMKMQQPSGSQ